MRGLERVPRNNRTYPPEDPFSTADRTDVWLRGPEDFECLERKISPGKRKRHLV